MIRIGIDTTKIAAVQLPDGWHDADNFTIGTYQFITGDTVHSMNGLCPSGFTFVGEEGRIFCGPLTSVLAVRLSLGVSL